MNQLDSGETSNHTVFVKIGVVLAAFVVIVGLFIYNLPKSPEVVHKIVDACKILTPTKAMDLLGTDEIIDNRTDKPKLSESTGTATSQCSYTDQTPDEMQVVALSVKSAYNDAGIDLISDNFTSNFDIRDTELVTGFGDSQAYFDNDTRTLNILRDTYWMIFSFGDGNDLRAHSLTETVEAANLLLGR